MMWSKKTLSTVLLLAVNFSGAEAGIWSGHDERMTQEQSDSGHVHYGVDVSFPIHYAHVSTNYDWLPHNQDPSISTPKEFEDMVPQPLGNKAEFYRNLIQGCRDAYGSKGIRCTQTELDRVSMNLRQPQSMQNYTDIGYKSKLMAARGKGKRNPRHTSPTMANTLTSSRNPSSRSIVATD
jgi:hypothetical protein